MIAKIKNKRHTLPHRVFSVFIAISFIFTSVITPSIAQVIPQTILNLPAPGVMVKTSAGFIPPMITGITLYPDNPLMFDFIVDTGDKNLDRAELEQESMKLIKYFLASLTVPEENIWVNLSPYEKDRIIPQGFDQTIMGRDMLAQDYLLKQLTASLMYPEDELGKEFWDRVYKRALEEYGTTEIPMNTFNKVWIMPDSASIYEHDNSVFVVESRLKVMLEEDYVAMDFHQKSTATSRAPARDVASQKDAEVISGVTSEVVRDILIPELEREVNEGRTFANLRQIFNSAILAAWYKQNLKESLLGQVYVNQNKTKGVDIQDKEIKQKIYDQYVEAFKTGVYNYIREDYDSVTQEMIPRKYFSGGVTTVGLDKITTEKASSPVVREFNKRSQNHTIERVTIEAREVSSTQTLEDVYTTFWGARPKKSEKLSELDKFYFEGQRIDFAIMTFKDDDSEEINKKITELEEIGNTRIFEALDVLLARPDLDRNIRDRAIKTFLKVVATRYYSKIDSLLSHEIQNIIEALASYYSPSSEAELMRVFSIFKHFNATEEQMVGFFMRTLLDAKTNSKPQIFLTAAKKLFGNLPVTNNAKERQLKIFRGSLTAFEALKRLGYSVGDIADKYLEASRLGIEISKDGDIFNLMLGGREFTSDQMPEIAGEPGSTRIGDLLIENSQIIASQARKESERGVNEKPFDPLHYEKMGLAYLQRAMAAEDSSVTTEGVLKSSLEMLGPIAVQTLEEAYLLGSRNILAFLIRAGSLSAKEDRDKYHYLFMDEGNIRFDSADLKDINEQISSNPDNPQNKSLQFRLGLHYYLIKKDHVKALAIFTEIIESEGSGLFFNLKKNTPLGSVARSKPLQINTSSPVAREMVQNTKIINGDDIEGHFASPEMVFSRMTIERQRSHIEWILEKKYLYAARGQRLIEFTHKYSPKENGGAFLGAVELLKQRKSIGGIIFLRSGKIIPLEIAELYLSINSPNNNVKQAKVHFLKDSPDAIFNIGRSKFRTEIEFIPQAQSSEEWQSAALLTWNQIKKHIITKLRFNDGIVPDDYQLQSALSNGGGEIFRINNFFRKKIGVPADDVSNGKIKTLAGMLWLYGQSNTASSSPIFVTEENGLNKISQDILPSLTNFLDQSKHKNQFVNGEKNPLIIALNFFATDIARVLNENGTFKLDYLHPLTQEFITFVDKDFGGVFDESRLIAMVLSGGLTKAYIDKVVFVDHDGENIKSGLMDDPIMLGYRLKHLFHRTNTNREVVSTASPVELNNASSSPMNSFENVRSDLAVNLAVQKTMDLYFPELEFSLSPTTIGGAIQHHLSDPNNLMNFRTAKEAIDSYLKGLFKNNSKPSSRNAKSILTYGRSQLEEERAKITSQKTSSPINKDAYGGINLNPELIDLQIKRDGNGVPLPVNLQPIYNMEIDGFIPIIINVTPVLNLPMLLGLADVDLPVDSADADGGSELFDISYADKYRNKYIRRYEEINI